jgi:hypothetical protein
VITDFVIRAHCVTVITASYWKELLFGVSGQRSKEEQREVHCKVKIEHDIQELLEYIHGQF